MDYLDFELEVDLIGGRDYKVSVRSPAGEARETMRFPFDEIALESSLKDLQLALLRSGGKRRRIPSLQEQTVQNFGLELFNSLIANEVRVRYDVSQRLAAEKGKGLRLVLRIRDARLAALPWEFLYDDRKAEYVCLSRSTPIVRYPDMAYPVQPLTVEPPLRILGMAVSPNDLNPLDVEREKQRVQEAVRRLQGLVTLTWFDGQTWQDILEAMQGGPWHIFHFIGHGGFNRQGDEGFIALADEDGRTFELSATNLARLLDHPHLKLVLLNACEGAHSSNMDVFSSTAAILVRSGIPSVVAMQYEITDAAAIEFSRSFYRAVARGMSIEAAVSEARKAISVAVSNTVEWGTPVLYLRAKDGHLFDVDLRQEHIDAIYKDARKAVSDEDWDEAIEKLTVVLNGDPSHAEARSTLKHAVAERKISELYAEGQALYQAGRLREALNCLAKVKAARGDYRDTVNLIVRIEEDLKEERIVALREEAEGFIAAEDFATAIAVFESALALDPANEEVCARLSRIREEHELVSLYAAGLRHYDARRWPDALELFTQIEGRAGEYKDVRARIANAQSELRAEEAARRLRARVDQLRREADRAASSDDWDAAAESLRAILNLDPSDETAAASLEEVERQKRLVTLYDRARKKYEQGQWHEALKALQRVSEIRSDYKDTEALISGAQGELEKIRSEEHRRARLKSLFSATEEAMRQGNWAKASELLRDAPEGPDEGRVTEYRQLIERGREREDLEKLYRAGRQLYDSGLMEQSLESFRAIEGIAGNYKDVSELIGDAEARLINQGREREPREEVEGSVEEAKTSSAAMAEPLLDAPATPLRPPPPTAEVASQMTVQAGQRRRLWTVILILIPLATAVGLALWVDRRGEEPTPVGYNNPPPRTPSPTPPEDGQVPPPLKVEALGELSAAHDLYKVTLSPDGRVVAAVGDKRGVSLWRVDDHSALPALEGASSPSRAIAISPDAAIIASGDDSGEIRLWRMGDGGGNALEPLRGHTMFIFNVAFSADGQTLTSISGDKNIRRWRVGDGKELESIKLPPRWPVVALGPDQRMVALYATSLTDKRIQDIYLWSLDERRTLLRMPQGSVVRCGAFSPDGGVLAVGSVDGTVRLWRVGDGSLLAPLKVEKGIPHSVTFGPDGQVVATGWRDGGIRLWRVSDGALLKEWKGHQDAVDSLSFSRDGNILASGGGRKIGLWRITGE